jgi:hypothetical protein
LPQEIKEYLANEHLNKLITDQGLEPEMLVWGLLHMIEILLKFANLQPNDLVEIMDKFVESISNGNGDKDYD